MAKRQKRPRCRECGGEASDADQRSYEVDPAPDVCERCLLPHMEWVKARLIADVDGVLPMGEVLARHFERLVDVGLRPASAAFTVRRMCQEAHVPLPRAALVAADPAWERQVQASGVLRRARHG